MPVLTNPRYERFAQALARGKSQAEAYEQAGYKPSDPHASRLASDGKVLARVAEIQARVAVRTELSVASVTERLLSIAAKAEALDAASGFNVARAAMMDAAQLNGLVVERKEVRTGELERMSEHELRDFLGREAAALSLGPFAAQIAGSPSKLN